MNRILLTLAALVACATASAADQAATPPAPAASATSADCTRVRVIVHQVNGKTVEVRKREPIPGCQPPPAVRLWD